MILFFFFSPTATVDHTTGRTGYGFGLRVEDLREARFIHLFSNFFTLFRASVILPKDVFVNKLCLPMWLFYTVLQLPKSGSKLCNADTQQGALGKRRCMVWEKTDAPSRRKCWEV